MAKNVTYKCRIKSQESLSKEGILEEIIISRNKSDKVELVWMPAHGKQLAKFAFIYVKSLAFATKNSYGFTLEHDNSAKFPGLSVYV